jgi:hypothetical protein
VSNYKDYLLNPNAENASIPMEAFSFLGVACGRAVRSNLFVYRVISTTGRNLKQKRISTSIPNAGCFTPLIFYSSGRFNCQLSIVNCQLCFIFAATKFSKWLL